MFETRGERQKELVKTIETKDITFVYGPAGTGKTAITIWKGLELHDKKKNNGLVITRPLVQVDGDLGFLPGTVDEKIGPYMAVVDEFLQYYPGYQRMVEQKDSKIGMAKLEYLPLELMRGRTFENKYIVLDEAQNCTMKQMQMFLTRLGKDSKMVITGDLNQCDLRVTINGLEDALNRFASHSQIGIVRFKLEDIQRHGLVGDIIRAYGNH